MKYTLLFPVIIGAASVLAAPASHSGLIDDSFTVTDTAIPTVITATPTADSSSIYDASFSVTDTATATSTERPKYTVEPGSDGPEEFVNGICAKYCAKNGGCARFSFSRGGVLPINMKLVCSDGVNSYSKKKVAVDPAPPADPNDPNSIPFTPDLQAIDAQCASFCGNHGGCAEFSKSADHPELPPWFTCRDGSNNDEGHPFPSTSTEPYKPATNDAAPPTEIDSIPAEFPIEPITARAVKSSKGSGYKKLNTETWFVAKV